MAQANVNLRKLSEFHCTVTITKELKFRLWIATKLMWLSMKILGGDLVTETENA